jgi:chemotaxis protein methyltransferase WspC
MKQVEDLLRTTIGLDSAAIGSTLIERAVRLRMKSHGLKKIEDYRRLLETSRPEWDELVESVLVTETWFFRDREAFAAFVRLVLEHWLPARPAAPLRLLSVPCASGEEPYSLVMALFEAGVPPDRFHLDAAEISARALARARRGVYGRNSFRGKDLGFRRRYFQAAKEGFVLNSDIRSRVHFHRDNLLSCDFLGARGNYDCIFCRNLLMYFDGPTRMKALQAIEHLLAPGGVLFVGAAEQPLVIEQGFVSANIPMAFACRRANEASVQADERHYHPVRMLRFPAPAFPTASRFTAQSSPGSPGQFPPAGSPRYAAEPELEKARRLADAGDFKEAAGLCEDHLRLHGASAQAYYLLGLLREARRDATAVDFYRKALYLEPGHYESLLQMALLSEKNGDLARAHTFNVRALRNKPKLLSEL